MEIDIQVPRYEKQKAKLMSTLAQTSWALELEPNGLLPPGASLLASRSGAVVALMSKSERGKISIDVFRGV